MGEAKRRREARFDAYATGAIFKPDPECPACHSRKTGRFLVVDQEPLLREHFSSEIAVCLECRAIWEPFPAEGYCEDPVCAEPCDNCAFRPGSPEQQDPERWKKLIADLKPDVETGMFTGRFYCHKGVPIDMEKGPGNFLFPKNPDGTPDHSKMRTCSGFLRMVWARAAKGQPRL